MIKYQQKNLALISSARQQQLHINTSFPNCLNNLLYELGEEEEKKKEKKESNEHAYTSARISSPSSFLRLGA